MLGDPPHYIVLEPAPGSSLRLAFQRVPEPKVTKNRLHLDLAVGDLDDATRRAVGYGAARVPEGDFEEYGIRWRVLLDPEGNEFCLVAQ